MLYLRFSCLEGTGSPLAAEHRALHVLIYSAEQLTAVETVQVRKQSEKFHLGSLRA